MDFFRNFVSNTLAGSGNQKFFASDLKSHTGRVFYKLFEPGEYDYSFLFSNIIDSTFADGSESHKNLICDSWELEALRVAECDTIDCNISDSLFKTVTVNGNASKTVMPGEFFSTDSIRLHKSVYICLEITYRGRMLPYHEEITVSAYTNNHGEWKFDKKMPVPSMVGCNRKASLRIAYWGDSITQGCGTPIDSYSHWNAVLSQMLGKDYAYWNLGMGYGRATDAASDGAWAFKARQNDVVFVCYGVNDINKGYTEEQIKNDLTEIVKMLKSNNITVILQTVPPFDYTGERIDKWKNINRYIKNDLSKIADLVFDNVPILSDGNPNLQNSKYGGHPNEEGCKLWAQALYPEVKAFFEKEGI